MYNTTIEAWRNAIKHVRQSGSDGPYMIVNIDMLEMALNELESYRKDEKQSGSCEPLRELLLRRESVPAPCVTVDGKPTKEWSMRKWYEKINSEVLEAYTEAIREEKINSYNVRSDKEPRELMDVITVCYSRLHAIGYGEHEIMQLQRLTNRKNEERGRLE